MPVCKIAIRRQQMKVQNTKICPIRLTSAARIAIDANPSRCRRPRAGIALVTWNEEGSSHGGDPGANDDSSSPVGGVLNMRSVGWNLNDVGDVLGVWSNGTIVFVACCAPGHSCGSTFGACRCCESSACEGEKTNCLEESHSC